MTFGSWVSITYGLLIEFTRAWKIKLVDDSFDDSDSVGVIYPRYRGLLVTAQNSWI
jgi:hypothetical protein